MTIELSLLSSVPVSATPANNNAAGFQHAINQAQNNAVQGTSGNYSDVLSSVSRNLIPQQDFLTNYFSKPSINVGFESNTEYSRLYSRIVESNKEAAQAQLIMVNVSNITNLAQASVNSLQKLTQG